MQQYKRDVEGDLWIPGSITVLGGINSSAYRQTVTRIAKTESNVTSIEGDVAEIESDIIALRDGIENAAMRLSLSTDVVKRRRDGKMIPASVLASSRKQDGTGYAGIFEVSISPDGQSYYEAYTSPSPELLTTYIVPAQITIGSTNFYIASILFRLYDADGIVLITEKIISVSLEAIALYWGARTSPPV